MLTARGSTVCGRFRGLPAATDPKGHAEGCGVQSWNGIAVNDRLDIVAYLDACVNTDTGEVYAPDSYFLAGPGGWVTFGPSGTGTVRALNAKGNVVGAIPVPTGGSHAFLWSGKRIVDLGTLGGKRSEATALNDRSDVVGTSSTGTGEEHGFLWRNGRMTDLGEITPLAVNERGAVLAARKEGKRLHAFLWRSGRTTDLGYWHITESSLSAGASPHALSLDDRGRVAGTDEDGHAVVWEAGRRTRLPELPGGKASAALAVNANAGIVGWSANPKGISRAVVWRLEL